MQIEDGGDSYGFCPGKATWDHAATEAFNILMISSESGVMPKAGGLYDQDADFIENLSWFLVKLDMLKFQQKVGMVLGSDSKTASAPSAMTSKRR